MPTTLKSAMPKGGFHFDPAKKKDELFLSSLKKDMTIRKAVMKANGGKFDRTLLVACLAEIFQVAIQMDHGDRELARAIDEETLKGIANEIQAEKSPLFEPVVKECRLPLRACYILLARIGTQIQWTVSLPPHPQLHSSSC